MLRVPEPWGLRPRSKEQQFALDLLLDPEVRIVALDGMAGTGKTLLALAAGLEQVIETSLYDKLSIYRPVVPVGKAELGFLPGTLDEKLEPVDDGGARCPRRPHRAAQPRRCPRRARGAHGAGQALPRGRHLPAGPVAARHVRARRRGAEPRADHPQDDPHPGGRGHQGGVHRRHEPDRRARTCRSTTTPCRCSSTPSTASAASATCACRTASAPRWRRWRPFGCSIHRRSLATIVPTSTTTDDELDDLARGARARRALGSDRRPRDRGRGAGGQRRRARDDPPLVASLLALSTTPRPGSSTTRSDPG